MIQLKRLAKWKKRDKSRKRFGQGALATGNPGQCLFVGFTKKLDKTYEKSFGISKNAERPSPSTQLNKGRNIKLDQG